MEKNNKGTPYHPDQEISELRLNDTAIMILTYYKNFAKYWCWDEGDIEASVTQDPYDNHKYILYQTENSGEYDPIKYPNKPQQLGYLEISKLEDDVSKPVDVKLVCSWGRVLSFWIELEQTLKYLCLEADTHHIPKNPIYLEQWVEVWELYINHKDKSIKGFSAWLRRMHPELPGSRDTIGKILKNGRAGLLESKKPKSSSV